MIITLLGADFSASNIGTLSSWRITRSLGTGAAYDGPTSVDKGASFTATVTIAEGYELGTAGVTVTMGGNTVSATTVNGNVITIAIAEVTGNVVIKVPTVNITTGEEEEPDVPQQQPITTLLTSVAKEVLRDTGLRIENSGTYSNEDALGRTTFTEIPVESNAFYYINHAIRIWYFDKDMSPILTINPSKYTPQFYIKTPSNAKYMSLTIRETLSSGATLSPDDATMVRMFDYYTAGTTMTISEMDGVTVQLKKALSSAEYKLTDKDANTTFEYIPVYGETTYYIENGLRLWFLADDKTSISTVNIASGTDVQYQFTTPINAAYISISVRNATTDGDPLDYNTMTMVVR